MTVGRRGMPLPMHRLAFRFHPLHLLVALVLVELILVAFGLLLILLGCATPAPMVTGYELPTR